MSNRVQINEEALEKITGGNITFDWNGAEGHCGLNGDKSYSFDNRTTFVSAVMQCYQAGMTDVQCLNELIANGTIRSNATN